MDLDNDVVQLIKVEISVKKSSITTFNIIHHSPTYPTISSLPHHHQSSKFIISLNHSLFHFLTWFHFVASIYIYVYVSLSLSHSHPFTHLHTLSLYSHSCLYAYIPVSTRPRLLSIFIQSFSANLMPSQFFALMCLNHSLICYSVCILENN